MGISLFSLNFIQIYCKGFSNTLIPLIVWLTFQVIFEIEEEYIFLFRRRVEKAQNQDPTQ